MDGIKLNDITLGLIYTAITSDIGVLYDGENGPICCFGNTEVRIDNESAPDLTIEEILSMVDMREIANTIYKGICDLDHDEQRRILNYINNHL